ncbi:hypothetical protein [Actinokineospora globicatena]|uniref:hypothetical protein n=1 Tax=Actinokineospora globicatena TaxID=103729 RepID=UPI0020A300B6|nr:hypothetical protein [Actinokineospora globicatena]MCP2302246.1 hypothetical protein [Actinokineospora globicatena]GLW76089.1 GTPase [Actinokineospora globicatena]GLW82924.1 GTPase [Actinokineospora globicatena]
MTDLPTITWGLLERATREAPPSAQVAGEWLARLQGPLRVGVVGAPGVGRSTVVRALAGAPFEVVEGDAAVRLWLVRRPDEAVVADAVSTIVVLARADELGGGRVDAVAAAGRVAARHAREDLGERCQAVVAVAALPAVGGLRLTRDDANALAALVHEPDALLSVDRLRARVGAALPDKLGMFGVRVAVELVRQGAAVPSGLVHHSGVQDLLDAVDTHFLARAGVLRARAALLAITPLLRGHPLSADVERVLASAHEPHELRLLAALDAGRVSFGHRDEEARYLLGAHGTSPAARLAVSGDAYPAHLRWQALTESPDLTHDEQRAAATVARSCAALVAVGVVE